MLFKEMYKNLMLRAQDDSLRILFLAEWKTVSKALGGRATVWNLGFSSSLVSYCLFLVSLLSTDLPFLEEVLS